MKTMIVTTPIRPVPTNFPPIGALSIIKYLRKRGIDDVEFYNIDANRPAYQAALEHIVAAAPAVLGISAVVSTAYAYVKRLSLDVKARLPDCLIVVGGNLAASAEILLKKTGTDLCVLGEGEVVFHDIVCRAAETRIPTAFVDITGLALLKDGRMVNTGYREQLNAPEVYDFDWADLAEASDISRFIFPAFSPEGSPIGWATNDPRAYEPHRRDKLLATLSVGKGCVAKCTFCHRWDKGIRHIPVDILMGRLEELIAHYNVGFVEMHVETFGADKRWLKEFCERIKPYDLLWSVGGIRTNTVTPEVVALMKGAGCARMVCGNETGSETMLKVMEKKVDLADNYNAARWIVEAGLDSIVQLVLAMPGESPTTVAETIAYCQEAMTLSPIQNPNDLSINYAQALPGTPLYEYARRTGLMKADLDGEEGYLLAISDRDAHDETTSLNFTDYPSLVTRTWRPLITVETNYAYVRKYGLKHYYHVLAAHMAGRPTAPIDSGYFANPKRLIDTSQTTTRPPSAIKLALRGQFGLAMIWHPVLFHHLRHLLPVLVFVKALRDGGIREVTHLLREYINFYLGRSRRLPQPATSLRKVVEEMGTMPDDSDAMTPLRKGR
ncbi:radical SAM protein [Magnetospirillum sp. ME-1]|uniref:B12-binding domain-containing radical SAM protein n=1 Tax=Magnetospirillum sp. ME-1 TaxID=1639348 RepID=UPI000A179E0E|nr:radical SAM protein [Magnetospirillum sp. ME-1]ARJ66551.1 radical SAM protein [Magnetospirillum sp. ME-1]